MRGDRKDCGHDEREWEIGRKLLESLEVKWLIEFGTTRSYPSNQFVGIYSGIF